jgi:hypothetical protein
VALILEFFKALDIYNERAIDGEMNEWMNEWINKEKKTDHWINK